MKQKIKKIKKVISGLKKASKTHAKQAKILKKSYKEEIIMLWHWLTLSKFFSKIGNYFYYKHV